MIEIPPDDLPLSPTDIILQLQNCLPLLTDRFHDALPVTGAVVSGGILTITFPAPHGMTVGDILFINEALIRNELVNIITNGDDTISYITQDVHDLTAYSSDGHGGTYPEGLSVLIETPGPVQQTVILVDDESGVPNENEFVGVDGSPVFPITGSEFLLENRAQGVKGFKPVDTVPNTTTITIDLADVPAVPDGNLVMSEVLTNIRVTTVANVDRAEKIYTKQSEKKDYLFLVMLDRSVSKNRANTDDFASLPGSTERLINIRQEFSTLVISPCENDLGAEETKSFVYVELFSILLKCLYGWRQTGYISDGESVYNTAFYAHAFDWEVRQQIDVTGGFENRNTVALRELISTGTPVPGELDG